MLVEAITYRFRGHSMADPEEYRTKEQVAAVAQARPDRDLRRPPRGRGRARRRDERAALDAEAVARVDAAVAFADASPFPPPESLYDDVYVLGGQVRGWWSLDERSPDPHRGEDERDRAVERRHGGGPRTRIGRAVRGRRDPAPDQRRRRRPGGPLSVAVLRYREALNQALREELRARRATSSSWARTSASSTAPSRSPPACWRSSARQRVRDTPISENTIVGMGVGAAMTGLRPGRRADDDQLLPAGDGPDRQPRRAHPLHVRRPGRRAARRPHAAGRRPPARPDALALVGGDVPPRARPARRRAVDAGRREGPAQGRRSATTTPSSSSSTSTSTASAARCPRTPTCSCDFGQAAIRREGSDVTIVGISRMAVTAEDAAPDARRGARGRGRGHRPAHAAPARPRHDPRLGAQDEPLRRSSRRAGRTAASARTSPR